MQKSLLYRLNKLITSTLVLGILSVPVAQALEINPNLSRLSVTPALSDITLTGISPLAVSGAHLENGSGQSLPIIRRMAPRYVITLTSRQRK